ncbi:MAG TPA: hypothetical protein VF178_14905 [Gemmatimonadaceae bacterium]
MLVLLILLSAVGALVATWALTGGFTAGSGNPLLSVAVAFAVALLWALGYSSFERNYLAARFARVRRRLALWGATMGTGEALLIRLWMDVEERNLPNVERAIADARRLGLDQFARAWASGHMARLNGDTEAALDYFIGGARSTEGLDRAELYCESALLLLQQASLGDEAAMTSGVRRAVEYIGHVDDLLDESPLGAGGCERLEYLALFHRALRGMVYARQARWGDAEARLQEVAHRVKRQHSLRARRLGQLARIERLFVIRAVHGVGAFDGELAHLLADVALPSLRARLSEIHAARQAEIDAQNRPIPTPVAVQTPDEPAPAEPDPEPPIATLEEHGIALLDMGPVQAKKSRPTPLPAPPTPPPLGTPADQIALEFPSPADAAGEMAGNA